MRAGRLNHRGIFRQFLCFERAICVLALVVRLLGNFILFHQRHIFKPSIRRHGVGIHWWMQRHGNVWVWTHASIYFFGQVQVCTYSPPCEACSRRTVNSSPTFCCPRTLRESGRSHPEDKAARKQTQKAKMASVFQSTTCCLKFAIQAAVFPHQTRSGRGSRVEFQLVLHALDGHVHVQTDLMKYRLLQIRVWYVQQHCALRFVTPIISHTVVPDSMHGFIHGFALCWRRRCDSGHFVLIDRGLATSMFCWWTSPLEIQADPGSHLLQEGNSV